MSHASQFVPVLLGGVGASALVAMVSHALLKTFLEARGVRPWTRRDSLGATPVLLLGAALLGGSGGTLLSRWLTCPGTGCAIPRIGVVLALAGGAAGLLATWLGLHALRKLT